MYIEEVTKFVMCVAYCHTSIKIWNFTPEKQLSIAFYDRVPIEDRMPSLLSRWQAHWSNLSFSTENGMLLS